MDARAEIRDFLTSRRARITPQQAGLPEYGGHRRVPGLRRSELATLAGISVEYLTQLERGNLAGASETVLDALARALQLDEAERIHLFDLARAASTPRRGAGRGRATHVRPSIQRILDTLNTPAYARTGRGDIVAVNTLCTALYGDILRPESLPMNVARFVFLDPRSQEFFLDWDTVADDTAAALRIQAGQTPTDRQLSDLIGELATRSDAFATRWAKHNVRLHRTATKRLHNPTVGDLELTGDALQLPGEDLTLIIYTATANSPAQEKLDFLTRWTGQQAPPSTTAETPTSRTTDT
ncbi:helix-turn-helix domain-containing protein [Ornithinimicrobium murale]|uniref:helix-turn-helix domain-containing protein n=1 Tax=Ornithinimicrobium murale TaxID=1050153 RepID=UPI000E0D5E87|nr:helix-turn-helix transcriptional regulator [Ornithinimicrobium murale]